MQAVTPPDLALARIITRRHGAFTRWEARASGFTDAMVETRVRQRLWTKVHANVFLLASARATPLVRYEAAALATPNAYVSGRAAAHVHQFDGCRAVAPEITVRNSGNARVEGVRVRRRYRIATTISSGIPVTSVAQTMLDIVPRLPCARLESIFDAAMLGGAARPPALLTMVDAARLTRAPGRTLFATLIDERLSDITAADSVLEMETHRLLRRAEIAFLPQARFDWWKGGRGRFDCLLPADVLLEADGRSWHARVEAFDEDRWRDATAAAHGLQVVRFSATHIRHRGDEVVELLHDIIRARTARRIA